MGKRLGREVRILIAVSRYSGIGTDIFEDFYKIVINFIEVTVV